MVLFAGVDIGGTNIVCGLADSEGNLINKIKQATEAHLGSDHVIRKVARMIDLLLTDSGTDKKDLLAVGAGVPGFVDPDRGVCLSASNLKWQDVHFANQLRTLIDIPVFIDNDVRMFTYSEATRGAAAGYNHVLGITLGTGIAAAVVNNGQIYYGGGFMAGEIGHILMDGVEYLCGCGMRGCLETVASASGIVNQARNFIAKGYPSILQEWFTEDNLAEMTAYDVSRACDAGDKTAKEIMKYTGLTLGKGLSYAVTLLSPDIIVIGGGAAMAGDYLLAPMREELQRSVYPAYWQRLTLSIAENNDNAGITGSVLMAKQKLKRFDHLRGRR